MNIYLDTNILYSDPFFKTSFSDLLLKLAESQKIFIIIPKVCLNELFFKLTNKAATLKGEVKSKIFDLNKWTGFEIAVPDVHLVLFENRIKQFYREKINNRIFIQIDYKTEYFEENIQKAIKSIPPFYTDKKEEFRDGLIWSSIREYVKHNSSVKHYFICNNFSDFWNHEKSDLHLNLRNECKEIVIVENIKKLFENEKELIDFKITIEFKKWLDEQGISIGVISEAVQKYLWNHLKESIDINIKRFPVKHLKPDIEFGYIEPDLQKENFIVNSIIEITPVENFAILEVSCSFSFTGKLFFPNYEKGNFSNFETLTFASKLILHLNFDKSNLFKPMAVEIAEINIT